MTGDKFRARADEYIKAAHSAADPVRKLALMEHRSALAAARCSNKRREPCGRGRQGCFREKAVPQPLTCRIVRV